MILKCLKESKIADTICTYLNDFMACINMRSNQFQVLVYYNRDSLRGYHSVLIFLTFTVPSFIFLIICCLSLGLRGVAEGQLLMYPGMGKLYISTSSKESWWVQNTITTRLAPITRGGVKDLQVWEMTTLSFLLKLPGRVAAVQQFPVIVWSGLEQMKQTSSTPAHFTFFFSLMVVSHLKGRGSERTLQSLTVPRTLSPIYWQRVGQETVSARVITNKANTHTKLAFMMTNLLLYNFIVSGVQKKRGNFSLQITGMGLLRMMEMF